VGATLFDFVRWAKSIYTKWLDQRFHQCQIEASALTQPGNHSTKASREITRNPRPEREVWNRRLNGAKKGPDTIISKRGRIQLFRNSVPATNLAGSFFLCQSKEQLRSALLLSQTGLSQFAAVLTCHDMS
jgi:hypothetical protein